MQKKPCNDRKSLIITVVKRYAKYGDKFRVLLDHMKRTATLFAVVFASILFALIQTGDRVSAAAGAYDTTFNGVGYRVVPPGRSDDRGYAVAVQSDGKIVVAGYASVSSLTDIDFAVARYNTDGSLDTTFNGSGKVTTPVLAGIDQANAVAIQSDGKIVVAGQAHNGSNTDFAVVRYNSDGSLDTTFNGTGKVTTAVRTGNDIAYAVAVQTDGKIVAAGYSTNNSNTRFALVRYNTNGTLDTSFDTDGLVITQVFSTFDVCKALAIQTDGKLVAAGYSDTGSDQDFAVVRYNTDGSLDTSFDTDGKVTTGILIGDQANAVAIQGDGKIVAAGYANNGTFNQFAVARYTTAGALDTTFNTDGLQTTEINSVDDIAYSIAIQASNGRIILAGYSSDGTKNNYALVRYNTNGSLDGGYSGDGKVTTSITADDNIAYGIDIQSDGRSVVAGYVFGSDPDFALARYNTNGSLDTTFNTTGKVTTDVGSRANQYNAVARQSDGKIVAAGFASNSQNNDFALTRINADGTLDTTFNGTGRVTTPVLAGDDSANAVAIQADGKIVAVGTALTGSIPDYAIVRYNTNGSLDTTFNGTGKVVLSIFPGDDVATAVAIQSDGKIVVVGYSIGGGQTNYNIVRYNTNGTLDTSFSFDGIFTVSISAANDFARAVTLQTDGKIVVAGSAYNGTNNDFAVVRINTNGTLDTTFHGTGFLTFSMLSGNDVAYSVAMQPDGKIILAGSANNGSNDDFAVARVTDDGYLDISWNITGKVTTAMLAGNDVAYTAAVQSDGKIVAAGSAVTGGQTDLAMARFTSTGALDTTFNYVDSPLGTGKLTLDVSGGFADDARAMAIDPESRFILAGRIRGYGGLLRLEGDLSPTAASVSVAGRVTTDDGQGLRNAAITATDQSGVSITTRTSTFGYFRFDSLMAGQTYVVTVGSKRYQFVPRVISPTEDLTDLDFTAASQLPRKVKAFAPTDSNLKVDR